MRFNWDVIGSNALSTNKLKTALDRWLADLDHAALLCHAKSSGHFSGPTLPWNVDGWRLTFTALPVNPKPRAGLVGIRGPGRARGVDNAPGVLRALDSKANKYGALDAPLVIAVLSNTDFPTRPYSTLEALYGLAALPPARAAKRPGGLARDGHWLTRQVWRRGHAPQVILASGLSPWRIVKERPQLWRTLEPGITGPQQPDWLDEVDVDGPDPVINTGSPLHELFDLPADWLTGNADFD